MFKKFPELTVALSEGGIGWIPYFLERLDYVYQHHKAWTGIDFGDKLPSEVFLEHVVTCFIDDAFGIENRDKLNLDMVAWECDYPHSDSTWPDSPETVVRCFDGVSASDIERITHGNALRLFSFDAFAHRPRPQCTVGALRAEVAGHDVSLVSTGKKSGPASLADLHRLNPDRVEARR